MSIVVTTHEAKSQLSKLIARAREGHEVVICRGDRPAARLIAYEPKSRPPRRRPQVGTVTSEPVGYEENAFEPLTEEALGEWGL